MTERRHTERGFRVYECFGDDRGAIARLQESSVVAYEALWLFAEDHGQNTALHLTYETAERLRRALVEWLAEHPLSVERPE